MLGVFYCSEKGHTIRRNSMQGFPNGRHRQAAGEARTKCCSRERGYHGHVTEETPEIQMERKRDTERIAHALCGLWEVQRRRLLMLADGKSMREIAREEKVQHRAVVKSIEGAKKTFRKNF